MQGGGSDRINTNGKGYGFRPIRPRRYFRTAPSRLRKITDLAFQDIFYVQVIGF